MKLLFKIIETLIETRRKPFDVRPCGRKITGEKEFMILFVYFLVFTPTHNTYNILAFNLNLSEWNIMKTIKISMPKNNFSAGKLLSLA